MSENDELKERIITYVDQMGLSLLGFAPVDRWKETGNQHRDYFPQSIWPWSKTVIVAGLPIFLPMVETTPSNLYSELYNTTNRLLDDAAYRLASLLFSLGHRAHFFPRDGYGEISALVKRPEAAFSQVMAAKYAGLGTIGANHCLLTPEYGPRVRWVSVITDAEFAGSPLAEKELCIRCGRCLKGCPIGAFTPRPDSLINDMEKYKCAQYHQFLRQELRYPCGVCTVVCPVGNDKKLYGENAISEEGLYHVQNFGRRYWDLLGIFCLESGWFSRKKSVCELVL